MTKQLWLDSLLQEVCIAKHWYTPLVEVNQAMIDWSFRQFLSLLEEKAYVLA